MRTTLIAQRYSKALIDLAIQKDQLDQVKADIELIRSMLTPELRMVMASAVISDHKKTEIFRAVYKDKLSPLTFSFFDLVFSKRRELVLPDIADEFIKKYRDIKGIETVEITTAIEISDQLKNNLRDRFQNLNRFRGKTIEIKTKVDENILGGFIARSNDRLFDASIKNDLESIGRQFLENMYVQKIR